MFPFEFGRCWIPSRSIFGERTRASINRASHPQGHRGTERRIHRETEQGEAGKEREKIRKRERERKVTELLPAVHHPSQEQTLARLFFLVSFIIISPRGNPPHHTLE